MKKDYELRCFVCQKVHTEEESVTTCLECGGPIETYHDYDAIRKKLNIYALKTAPISALKYMAFYPIDDYENAVSLQEGGTPLIHAKNFERDHGMKNVYIKNEALNPTGCFKDRGTLVEVTKAKEMGAKAICLASTGNMAASVSAYATASGIDCFVLVPENTPSGKLAQTLSYGAKVIKLRGDYSRCATLAEEMAKRFGYYLAGDYTFRSEGQKSQGYEIVEQLFWRSPDYILCPVGCGTNFHAIYKGIKELYDFGFIQKLPKLIAVQTPGCNPIVQSVLNGRVDYDVLSNPQTVASAMKVGNPIDGPKILADIYESGGTAVEVTDQEILEAQQEQARQTGVFAEPSGSMAYAAAKKLAMDGFFKADDTVVCMATGSGLKDTKAPMQLLADPATLDADFGEIERFIEQGLHELSSQVGSDKSSVLLSETPISGAAVAELIEKTFSIKIQPVIADAILADIERFLEKGKDIKQADLLYILEAVLDQLSLKNRVLEVKDFKISTTLHGKAEAEIWAVAHGKEVHAQYSGVGPVDAAIEALKKASGSRISLTDYNVEIDSNGVDAAVEVKMTLKDEEGHEVLVRATSPDIIVASIRAFEKGVNILSAQD
jgi:threonine synthase